MKKHIGYLLLLAAMTFSTNASQLMMSDSHKEKTTALNIYNNKNAKNDDLIKAIIIFEKHSDSDPRMKYYYGLSNVENKTSALELNRDLGFKLIQEAALLGDEKAQYYIAMDFIKSGNVAKGVDFLKKSSKRGNSESQYQLGKMYYQGNGVPKNRQNGFKLIKIAADKGVVEAQYDLARIYFSQDSMEIKKGGVHWLKVAYKNGKKQACDDLYKIYLDGIFVNQNIREHIRYLECSAFNNNKEAMKLLVGYLEQGTYLAKDNNKAMYWHKKLADFGEYNSIYVYSIHNLSSGNSKLKQAGLTKLQNISNKHLESAFLLGKIYKYGLYDINVSKKNAIRFFELASKLGSKEASDEMLTMFK